MTAHAGSRGVARASGIRRILDAALDTGDPERGARAAIFATAGMLARLNVEHVPMLDGLEPALG